jgi:hypothetical protein
VIQTLVLAGAMQQKPRHISERSFLPSVCRFQPTFFQETPQGQVELVSLPSSVLCLPDPCAHCQGGSWQHGHLQLDLSSLQADDHTQDRWTNHRPFYDHEALDVMPIFTGAGADSAVAGLPAEPFAFFSPVPRPLLELTGVSSSDEVESVIALDFRTLDREVRADGVGNATATGSPSNALGLDLTFLTAGMLADTKVIGKE